jgi:flagellar motor switch protein FliN
MTDEKEMGLTGDEPIEEQQADIGVDNLGIPVDSDEKPKDFAVVNEGDQSEEEAEAAMLAMLDKLPQEERSSSADDIHFASASASKAEFQQLSQPAGSTEKRNIDLLMDVDLPVAIELGRTKLAVSEILALGPGSVVELNKLAGEPVDLLVNHKVVAKGEVVVIDENFGLRITQLVTPEERLRALGAE